MIENNRYERGLGMWMRGMASRNGAPGQWYVRSDNPQSGRYLVATPWAACEMTCNCPDHAQRGMVCKHMVAASLAEAAARIREYLKGGGDLQELKNQAIMAGLQGPASEKQALIWRAGYEIVQMIEDGELDA